jgi:hypothetical protein
MFPRLRGNAATSAFIALLASVRDHVKMSFAQRQPVEEMMVRHMVRQMKENHAPAEQFERLGLPVVRGVD